jgi:hypothetical protein
MKSVIIGLLTLTAQALLTGDLTQELKEAKIKVDLPNDSWYLASKQDVNEVVVYNFKRKPIEDNEGRQIIPNISVIIENVDNELDAVTYSALKRSKVNFKISEVFTHESGLIGLQNAIGYKGTYTDKGGLDHTVYIVHCINNKKGVQLICDTTTDILDKMESEFLMTLESIRK